VQAVSNLPFGATDCAPPMLDAVVGFDTGTPQLVSAFARGGQP
jgi:hypothetical protein